MRALDSLRTVLHAMEGRLHAELYDQALHMDFAVFDLTLWDRALANLEDNGDDTALLNLYGRAERVAAACPRRPSDVTVEVVVGELKSAAVALRALARGESPIDNRAWWGRVHQRRIKSEITSGSYKALDCLVRWYLSISDGTCAIERDFSRHTRILDIHRGPLDDTLHGAGTSQALLLLLLDGPRCDKELAIPSEAGSISSEPPRRRVPGAPPAELACLGSTPFTRRCAELWVERHGRRFGVYKRKADGRRLPVAPRQRTGTAASVARGQKRALDTLAESHCVAEASIFGDKLRRYQTMAEPAKPQELEGFRKLTGKKLQQQRAIVDARAAGGPTHCSVGLAFAVVCGVLNRNSFETCRTWELVVASDGLVRREEMKR